jgi:hypothetical protein
MTPVEAEIFNTRANSYHSIPVHPQTGTWPVDQGVPFAAPTLILEQRQHFCGAIFLKGGGTVDEGGAVPTLIQAATSTWGV